MIPVKDITGQRFGRLVAIRRVESRSFPCGAKLSQWECLCDCGKTTIVNLSALTKGNTKSCGCLGDDVRKAHAERVRKHGESHTRLNHIWGRMKARCYNPNIREYKWYGAKGVQVCDEWRNSYEAFRDWSLSHGYNKDAKRSECTLDRINPYGNYEPSNCRWVPMSVQLKNQRKDYDKSCSR